jgi:hypothetical protein
MNAYNSTGWVICHVVSLSLNRRRLSCEDLEIPDDHPHLGRLAVRDWRYRKVLDKMMLYERRIENSMYKTIRELERLQKMRKGEQARVASCRGRPVRASRGHPLGKLGAGSARDLAQHSESNARAAEPQSVEGSPPAPRRGSNLKKQSQFALPIMGTMPCAARDYDDGPPAGRFEYKNLTECLAADRIRTNSEIICNFQEKGYQTCLRITSRRRH